MSTHQLAATYQGAPVQKVKVSLCRLPRSESVKPTWLVTVEHSGSNIIAIRKFVSFDEALAFAQKVMAQLGIVAWR